jgi:hypothetical protein
MRSVWALTTGVLCFVAVFTPAVVAGANGQTEQRIDLKILYVGNPKSPRGADFAGFLREHFVSVETIESPKFSTEQARRFDVVVIAHEGGTGDVRRFTFPKDYAVPTVTVGASGATIGNINGLKTGYL